jgi:hypothetical protein
VKEIFESLKSMINQYFDEDQVDIVYNIQECKCILTTPWFFLYTSYDDIELTEEQFLEYNFKFFLSFNVTTSINAAADTMRLLTTIIPPADIILKKEHHISKDQITYGEEAYQSHIEEIQKMNGKVYCNCCETYVPQKLFNKETGICKICSEITLKKVTFH